MALFAGLSVSVFNQAGWSAVVVWIALLVSGGMFLRRNIWMLFRFAAQAFSVALVATFIIVTVLAALGDNPLSIADATSAAGQMMVVYYLPFFWLPLAVGLITGGFLPSKQEAEQVGAGDAEKAV